MRNTHITFRVTESEKEAIVLEAKNQSMGLTEYILSCIKDKQELTDLNDSQGQFLNLFDTAYKRSADPFFKQEMSVLKKLNLTVPEELTSLIEE